MTGAAVPWPVLPIKGIPLDPALSHVPRAKLVGFSILYGSGPKGLAEGMTNKVGAPTTTEEAQMLMGRFFGAYPALKRRYVEEQSRTKAGDERTRTLTGRLRLLDKEFRYGR